MSELGDKRRKFTRLIIVIVKAMLDDGLEPMFGKEGEKHMANSLHYDGLAMDIILTKNGQVLEDSEDHRKYGELWESLDPDCYWGGDGLKKDGLKNDGNHYSITMGGRK